MNQCSMPKFEDPNNSDCPTHHIFWIAIPLFQPLDIVEDSWSFPFLAHLSVYAQASLRTTNLGNPERTEFYE